MTTEIVLGALVVLVVVVWLALAKANRIDLLHQKVTRAAGTLEAQLLRRAGLAAELAASGRLDPASSLVVAEAADRCLGSWDEEVETTSDVPVPGRASLTAEREAAESDLSRALRQALETAGPREGDALVSDVVATGRRVALARRFHNDGVAQAVRIRSQSLVRLLRLAGRARMPRTFEMDDAPPVV